MSITAHAYPGLVLQPTSVTMLSSFVAAAAASGQQLKVIGAGHSFSPITLTDPKWDGKALMLNLDKLAAVLELPTADDMTVLVEAGIRVQNLNAALLAAAPGYALINTGAIAMQSAAGATQTGTYGTGQLQGCCCYCWLRRERNPARLSTSTTCPHTRSTRLIMVIGLW